MFEDKLDVFIRKSHEIGTDEGHDAVQDCRLNKIHMPYSPIKPLKKGRMVFEEVSFQEKRPLLETHTESELCYSTDSARAKPTPPKSLGGAGGVFQQH